MPKIKLRRGLETNLPILDESEAGYTTDSNKLFIGSSNGNVEFPNKLYVETKFQNVVQKENGYVNSSEIFSECSTVK
jgi:hypothetical protein